MYQIIVNMYAGLISPETRYCYCQIAREEFLPIIYLYLAVGLFIIYLQDTPTTFESYIETAESTGERSRAIEEIPDNARWDRRNRSFDRIDPRTCVQSLTILSQSKLEIPKAKGCDDSNRI